MFFYISLDIYLSFTSQSVSSDRLITGFKFNPKFIGFLNSGGLYTDHRI